MLNGLVGLVTLFMTLFLLVWLQNRVDYVTEESAARYSIHDVVLPLPGYDMLYPRNKGGHTVAEKLSSGLQERGYAHKQRVLISCSLCPAQLENSATNSWRKTASGWKA